jgi:hypothetical protein
MSIREDLYGTVPAADCSADLRLAHGGLALKVAAG